MINDNALLTAYGIFIAFFMSLAALTLAYLSHIVKKYGDVVNAYSKQEVIAFSEIMKKEISRENFTITKKKLNEYREQFKRATMAKTTLRWIKFQIYGIALTSFIGSIFFISDILFETNIMTIPIISMLIYTNVFLTLFMIGLSIILHKIKKKFSKKDNDGGEKTG